MTPEVVYIAGYGRMGSTLLGQILGQAPDAVFLGEVRHIWDRGLRDDQLCECGKAFSSCEYWPEVMKRAFGSIAEARRRQPWVEMEEISRLLKLPGLMRSDSAAGPNEKLARYAENTRKVLTAAADLAGATTIVDSSKTAGHGYALTLLPFELKVVHMIRDSRAVAFSWARVTPRPEIAGETAYVRRRSAVESALKWVVAGILANRLINLRPGMTVRYEDLTRAPEAELRRIAGKLGLGDVPLPSDGAVDVSKGHSVAGNRSRFRSGRVVVRDDDSWMSEMSGARRELVWSLTWPWARRYGYRHQPGRLEPLARA